MIDWSRRTRGAQTEAVSETEALTSTTSHNRSISEVTTAVANEAQGGFSHSDTTGSSEQEGAAGGGMMGWLFGFSAGTAASTATTTSYSVSAGHKELSASMSQNIVDSTHQAANAARNRRASVIREVSQAESEQVTTRVIANYNHMHALSVSYYEVVQIYRVSVQLADIDRCLFVPFLVIDFTDANIVRRFRLVLAAAALRSRGRGGDDRPGFTWRRRWFGPRCDRMRGCSG